MKRTNPEWATDCKWIFGEKPEVCAVHRIGLVRWMDIRYHENYNFKYQRMHSQCDVNFVVALLNDHLENRWHNVSNVAQLFSTCSIVFAINRLNVTLLKCLLLTRIISSNSKQINYRFSFWRRVVSELKL